jgi:hypothetical protein
LFLSLFNPEFNPRSHVFLCLFQCVSVDEDGGEVGCIPSSASILGLLENDCVAENFHIHQFAPEPFNRMPATTLASWNGLKNVDCGTRVVLALAVDDVVRLPL